MAARFGDGNQCATAQAFAEAGAAVVLADINDETIGAATDELTPPDIAGIQVPRTDAADEPAEHFDRVNEINLRGVWTA